MWDVGNESVLGLQNCYSGDELERQRDAYTTLVNDITKKIHAVDPNHPVTSTDAWVGAWPYFKKNAPDLDLYAVNSYNAVCDIKSAWQQGGYTKPYIVTETGPAGEWEVPNDANGVPLEPSDQAKADGYTRAWNCVTGHKGVALGATMFHYGTEYDFGGIWFNLLPAGQKRLSYYAVKRAYGGDTSHDNTPPVISDLTVEGGAGQVQAGRDLVLSVRATDPDGDPISYEVLDNSNYVDQSKNLVSLPSTNLGGGRLKVTAPDRPGVWKVYVKATDGRGNVGVETRSIRVVPPVPSGTNVARGRPATASSYQASYGDCPCTAANAVDGNQATRWASDWSDPSGSRSISAPAPRSGTSSCPGRPRTPRPTRSRPPTTARTGRPCAPFPTATEGSTTSTSPGPAATSASTARRGARVMGIRCTSSASTPDGRASPGAS